MTKQRLIASIPLLVLIAIDTQIAGVGSALAQELPAEVPGEPAIIQDKHEAHFQGVYLDDSFEAIELIQDIRELANNREWKQALVKLKELLDQFDRRVIQWQDGVYINVGSFANREISAWPDDGLQAYRQKFEPPAKLAFDEAMEDHDIEKLTHLFGRYFCTSTAIQAGDTLAQISLEAGLFHQAQMVYEQLLNTHPDRDINNLEWHAKMAICLVLAGKTDSAGKLLDQMGPPLQQHPIVWKGRHETCQSIIAEIESNPITTCPPEALDWPMFGGNTSRSLLPEMDVLPTAPLWTFDDFTPSALSQVEGYYQSSSYRSAYTKGKFLALYPVMSGGLVLLNDAMNVWALRQETGTPAWSYQGVTPSNQDTGWGDRSLPLFHSCTAHNDRVYVELGNRVVSYYGYQPQDSQSVLACLDAETGRQIWKISPQDFGADPREVQFEGPVVADDSGIYVIARRRKPFGFEDCYLWKFNESGNIKWRTHLGSASTGSFGYRRPTLSISTLVDGSIYVQSNLGTIAAVDVITGLIQWICVYSRDDEKQRQRWQHSTSEQIYPWHYNPVLFSKSMELLVAMPLDISRVLLVDRRSGFVEDEIPKNELFHVESLLGIVDGKLYGVGERVFSWDMALRKIVWSEPLHDDTLYGRAALSKSHIFLPCHSGLLAYPLRGGKPTIMQWDPMEEGGNVVVLPNQILIAGNERITSYGLRESVFASLQTKMAQNPSDPIPALKLAEVAYRTASTQPAGSPKQTDYDRGRQALRETVQRAGGFAAAWEPELKERLFTDCLLFAQLHLKEKPADPDRALELLIMAGQCPPDREHLLKQKAKLAAVYDLKQEYTNVIQQYHQILLDRSLHNLPWPGPEEEKQTSQQVCRRKIANLIAEHGREIYKPFDDKAARMLAAGSQANDLKKLDQIIETMPNSLAAPKALKAKGTILRDLRHQPIQAARSFYAALTRYSQQIDRPETIRQIADCYVQAEKPAVAWLWLTKAARELPGARVRHQGQHLTFLQYRQLLGNVEDLLTPRLPLIGALLKDKYQLPLNDEDHLLHAVFRRRRDADWSRFLIYSQDGVTAYEAITHRVLWPEPFKMEQKPRLLANLANIIILATQFEIRALNPVSGKTLWRYGDTPQGIDDPHTDPESFPKWRIHRLYENRLVSCRDDALAVCLDICSGQLIWKRDLDEKPTQTLSVGENLMLYCTTVGNRQICRILSADDGQLQRVIELPENRPVLNIVQTYAGNAILVTAQSLIAVDPLSGKIEWQSEFDNNLLLDTVQVVLDGIILSVDGMHIIKLNLDGGGLMWQTDALRRVPSELDLIVADEDLYALTEKSIYSLDPISGRTLGQIQLPVDTRLAYLLPTDHYLVLICRSALLENGQIEYAASFATRHTQMDRQLNLDQFQLLGQFPGTTRFYCFDHAIITVSEKTLQGWVDTSN